MRFTPLLRMRWTRVISEAEKLVGYTGSSSSLQYILTDEMAQLALNVRKLMNTKHPLVKTAKHFVYDGSNAVQTWGLTILLISRAANCSLIGKINNYPTDEIFSIQRNLAEITELIFAANLIHRGILNAEDMQNDQRRNLTLGNKMSVLGGDYLLANASMALAKLKNPKVVNDIAQAIADMTESEFVNEPKSVNEWAKKVYLASGSLLAQGCRSSLELVGHNEEYKTSAFEFGKSLSTTFAIHRTLDNGRDPTNENALFSTELLSKIVDSNKTEIIDSLKSYGNKALKNLETFPPSDAKSSLEKMTNALMTA